MFKKNTKYRFQEACLNKKIDGKLLLAHPPGDRTSITHSQCLQCCIGTLSHHNDFIE
jgi:hypothetical protein